MTRAQEIAREMQQKDTWDLDLCGELCSIAGMSKEWDAADGDTFESVVFDAAEKLGVEVL